MTDGAPSLSYGATTNRISTAGYQYDSAGNLTRGQAESGVWQRYQYDAANRLVAVMNDSSVVIVTNSYGSDNGKLKSVENGVTRWYGWDGGQSIIEYSDNGTNLVWAKSYVYLGGRLLLTDEPVTGRQYHHADRLGTRIVTNASGAKLSEQATLPFGTALGSPETTGTPTNRRFTSYERSGATKLDYAVNRSYASWQGKFTQVDPLGMGAVSVGNPQSLNLYGYVENDPVNFVDPSGLLTCYIDGIESDCASAYRLIDSGLGVLGPLQSYRYNSSLNGGKGAWEYFTVDARGYARWKYWETHVLSQFDGFETTIWTEKHLRTSFALGYLTEWKGRLAFDSGGVFFDFRGRLIGENPIEMQMLGPLDYIGAGEIKAGGALAGVLISGSLRGVLSATTKYLAKNFVPSELERHFAKHAAEWGAGNITKIGYLKRAQNLLNRDIGGNILGKVRANGDILRYNIRTNEFAVGAADGTIRTLFRPKDGLSYWLSQ